MQPLLAGVNLLLEMSQCGPGRTSCQLAPPWTIGSAAHITSLLPVTSADDNATTAHQNQILIYGIMTFKNMAAYCPPPPPPAGQR